MKLIKSQKISLGILGLCICAFAADRIFSDSEPASRVAITPSPVPVTPVISVNPNTIQASVPSLGAAEMAKALQQLARANSHTSEIRDAFAIPAGLVAGSDNAPSTPDERVTRFQTTHHLKAIIDQGGSIRVVMDGRLICRGQSVDGFQLVLVRQLSAVFAADNLQAELSLPKRDGSELPE